MMDDVTLLRRYAEDRDEAAFAELVRRNLPLVYSAAIRRLGGDAHRANDVSQMVFCTVARDAQRLSKYSSLTGWFYTATRNAVIDALRAEHRRRAREEEAHIMQETSATHETSTDWSRLRPVLDIAMDDLRGDDREAVLLRFFQGRPFAEVGRALGSSEEAARKRVDRALDKLRVLLRRHGIASTSMALAALLTGETVSAAPAALAASVTGAALATGGAATIGVGAFVTVTKLQAAIAAAVIVGGAVGLISQNRTISALREHVDTTQRQLAKLADENAAFAVSRGAATAELVKLREQNAATNAAPLDAKRAAETRAISNGSGPAPARLIADTAETRQKKADLHRRYDPFLQKWGLSPEQADRFVELKIAIYDAQDDLQGAVRDAGAQGGTAAVEAMRSKLVGPMWDDIRQLLGAEGFKAYGDYESSSFYRLSFVEPLLPMFAAARAPLSSQQADELVQLFAANSRSARENPTDISSHITVDWETLVAQAGRLLAPEQLDLLQSYANRKKIARQTP